MNIVAFCRRNSYAVFLLTAFLVGAGLFAMFELPSNIYPELNFPRIVILGHSGDLAPETMLLSVTRPLEEATATVFGVYRVRSKTIRGATEISVLFNPDMDMQSALQLVQGKVGEARGSLPPDTDVEVERISPVVFPVFSVIVNGNVPGADLRDYAFYVLRPLFTRVQGVGNVEVQATQTREVSILADPQKLIAHRLTLVDVADRLKATNEITSVGRLPKDYLQYLVLSTGQFTSLDQIRNTVVAIEGSTPIYLRDVAEVRDGVEDPRILITGNGEDAALINVSRQIGGNIIQIVNDLKSYTASVSKSGTIPKTLRLSVVYDLAEFVHESIANVRDAVLIGAVLAVVILFVFLREGRTTMIAATSLPLSVIGTFFFVRFFNGTLNLMSLGGLAVAIGLIIDDAVVIIENIYRHLGLGESPEFAAERGTSELLPAVVGSTATTLVVFLPLGLLKGFVGDFFRALCLTLGVSVLLSLIFAVTIIPLLSQRFLTAKAHRSSSDRFIEPVNRTYERGVRWALGHRWIVAGVTLVLLGVGVFLYTGRPAFLADTLRAIKLPAPPLETGFLPEMDEGGYVLDYWMPPGTSLAQTDLVLRQIEKRIHDMKETDSFSRRTGAEMGLFVTQQNRGDILVKLKPRSQRSRSADEVINDIRAQVEQSYPATIFEFSQILQDMLGDLQGTPEPVEIKLFGNNMQDLEKVGDAIEPKLKAIQGIVDFKGVQQGNPEIVFRVDPALAGRAGLTVDQVSQQVSAGLLGLAETSLRQADRTINIRVRFPDPFRYNYENIRQFPIVTQGKQVIPLASVAQVEQVSGESELSRENQRLMVALTARLENRDLGSAIKDVQAMMKGIQMPEGATFEIGGQYESQQSSFHDLLVVLGLALAAVFTVLVAQFRSFLPALIILSAAPLALVGVFGMLVVTGTPLNVSSLMGIILMVGLVVKNGIILFEYVHVLWEEQGMPLDEALIAAGRIRVRPILMTTLATLFGLLPLALGLGSGAELQKPLALAVIGGLLLSTFITLLVIPVFYSLLTPARVEGAAKA